MQAAKDAVRSFTSRQGHKTEVDETVHPSVTSETVKPHQHQETTQAIDKEVHQHHYHTTVQPLQHEERLPEKHVHQAMPTEHREIVHEDPTQTKQKVQAELAQFKPSSRTVETTTSASSGGAVTGEHVHHHVHENVVPVVHKSTIQPEVVHTTQQIHETHHAPAQHHGISQLPMKSLNEFKTAGGVLTGNGEQGRSHEEYDGCPRPYNEKLATTFDKLGLGHHGHHESDKGHRATDSGIGMGQGQTASLGNASDGLNPGHKGVGSSGLSGSNTSSGLTGSHQTGTERSGLSGTDVRGGSGLTGSHNSGSGLTGGSGTNSGLTGSRDHSGLSQNSSSGLTGSHNNSSGLSGSNNSSSGNRGVGERIADAVGMGGNSSSSRTGPSNSSSRAL